MVAQQQQPVLAQQQHAVRQRQPPRGVLQMLVAPPLRRGRRVLGLLGIALRGEHVPREELDLLGMEVRGAHLRLGGRQPDAQQIAAEERVGRGLAADPDGMVGSLEVLRIEAEQRSDVDVHEARRDRREFVGNVAPREAVDRLEGLRGDETEALFAALQGEEHRRLGVLEVHGQVRTVRVEQQRGRLAHGEISGQDLRRATHRCGHGSVVRVLDDSLHDVERVILYMVSSLIH